MIVHHRIRKFLFADIHYVVDWFSEVVFLIIIERCRGVSLFVRIACPTVHKTLLISCQIAIRCNCESFQNIRLEIRCNLLITYFRCKYLYCKLVRNLTF
jgi:hypothetical protein